VVVTPFPPTVSGIADYGFFVTQALALTGKFGCITVLTNRVATVDTIESSLPLYIESIWQENTIGSGWKIATRILTLKPDEVWFNLGISSFGAHPLVVLSGLLSIALVYLAGFPTIMTLHEMIDLVDVKVLNTPWARFFKFARWLIRNLNTFADVRCVMLKQHLELLLKHSKQSKIVYIPHSAYQVSFPPESDKTELLAFAAWAPYKGLEQLLTVFPQLCQYHPALRLTIVGGEHPRFQGYLNQLRQEQGMHPHINWLGYVPQEELLNTFVQATILVVPYTATTGASGIVLRTAGLGRPMVVSDLPELRATLEDVGLRAAFYPANDLPALFETLNNLLTDSALRFELAQHNYNIIRKHLTLTHTAQAYINAFDLAKEVCKNRQHFCSVFQKYESPNI
jgi:glycosyltransferase involved in cell wall biosynthesis